MSDNKIEIKDTNETDKKIPQGLLMQYQGKWYILKAGLEWKANYLYGGGSYGVTTDIVEHSPDYALAKAIFRTKEGVEFSNYGEASKLNVSNPIMHKYLLHLAITRAECRVLRMATACGYTSVEEMDISGNGSPTIPIADDDDKIVSAAIQDTVEKLCTMKKQKNEYDFSTMTMRQAREEISRLTKL